MVRDQQQQCEKVARPAQFHGELGALLGLAGNAM